VVKKPSAIDVRNADTGKVLQTFEGKGVSHVYLSPQGSYLLTYQPVRKGEETDGNLKVWHCKTSEMIGKFILKSMPEDTWPAIKWTEDESIAARRVTNEIHFWPGSNVFGMPVKKLREERVSDFSLSPGKIPFNVGVFVPEKKGAPAEVKIYQYPSLRLLCTKSFYADAVSFKWSNSGKHSLVSVSSHVDRTGRNYYGQSGLYFLSEKLDCMVDLSTKKEGPVHASAWHPAGEQFVSVYGFMPPKSTLLNLKCDPIADFGVAHRNMAQFSPDGRILWLAGLGGGLKGEMDFWNPKSLTKFGSAEASSSATHCEWSPDSLHVMTAILSPRMRVDNRFIIWSYNGEQKYKEEFKELLFINYRPQSAKLFPQVRLRKQKKPTEEEAAAAPPKKTAYRHPNFSGASSSVSQTTAAEAKPMKYKAPGTGGATANKNYVPGMTAAPNSAAGKSAAKNRKRRANKKQTENSIPGM
tara:strand:+ start:851 stop:2254 length:1404 start_codon:yes stop_codon:yes gene_type:complete